MNELLKVSNLCQYFPLKNGWLKPKRQVYAVDGISFSIAEGETLGLVGESGCGKSSLGKTLLKLYQPTSGTIELAGRDITHLSQRQMRPLRQDIQIIFQDPMESLNARHTVEKILQEPFEIHGIGTASERSKWVGELLEKVGLPSSAANKYPHEFSGGQRQRIGIARAIALKPKLIVCDEAVSALDVSVQSQILNLLLKLQQEMNLALIFIAHDLSVVRHISDRIAVMYLGRIVEIGERDEIYHNPKHPYTQSLIAAIPTPDPRCTFKAPPLKGDVPSPINRPSGCHFHTRCPLADAECSTCAPQLTAIDQQKQHLAACLKLD